MTLRYTRKAAFQLEDILSHIVGRSPSGAARLLARIEEIELLLLQFPRSGRATTIPGIRRIPIVPYPYVLYDRCAGDDVIVQRIRHTSRRPTNP